MSSSFLHPSFCPKQTAPQGSSNRILFDGCTCGFSSLWPSSTAIQPGTLLPLFFTQVCLMSYSEPTKEQVGVYLKKSIWQTVALKKLNYKLPKTIDEWHTWKSVTTLVVVFVLLGRYVIREKLRCHLSWCHYWPRAHSYCDRIPVLTGNLEAW